MAGNLLMSFLNKIELLDEDEYAENFIGCMLSPVITGIKPASTITLKIVKESFIITGMKMAVIYWVDII